MSFAWFSFFAPHLVSPSCCHGPLRDLSMPHSGLTSAVSLSSTLVAALSMRDGN